MMVTFLAKIHIDDNKYINAEYIESPFRCSILIDDKYYSRTVTNKKILVHE